MSPSLTIGILVFPGVLTSDVTAPLEVFGAARTTDSTIEVLLISATEAQQVRSEEGLLFTADVLSTEAPNLDVLVVPGAMDVERLKQSAELRNFIVAHEDGWIGSNCAGAFILGSTGVLDGHRATTYAGGESILSKEFPAVDVVERQRVVLDGKRITSHGGITSYDAAILLLRELRGDEAAKVVFERLSMGDRESWKSLVRSARGGRLL